MDLPAGSPTYFAIAFAAQLVDSALGMGYGITASSLLLGLGVPPAVTSATVHAAECCTIGSSALSHRAFGNIDRQLFRRLLLPAVLGAAAGAYLLTWIDGQALVPWIAGCLLLLGAVGGVAAAPLGVWLVRYARPMSVVVGRVVIALSMRTLLVHLEVIQVE